MAPTPNRRGRDHRLFSGGLAISRKCVASASRGLSSFHGWHLPGEPLSLWSRLHVRGAGGQGHVAEASPFPSRSSLSSSYFTIYCAQGRRRPRPLRITPSPWTPEAASVGIKTFCLTDDLVEISSPISDLWKIRHLMASYESNLIWRCHSSFWHVS